MVSTCYLDFRSWTREHWKLFIITSISFFIDGLIFSISPLIIYSVKVLLNYATYILAVNMLFWTAGSLILGRLGDIIGRRLTFIIVLLLEFTSVGLLLLFYNNLILFTLLTSLACFAIGGEFGAAFSALAELVPPEHRGKSILLSSNFWNLGAVVVASLSLICYTFVTNPSLQIRYLLAAAFTIIVLSAFARIGFPESLRWLIVKGKLEDVKRMCKIFNISFSEDFVSEYRQRHGISLRDAFVRYTYRFAILLIITVSIYVTYFVPAFYLPYTPDFPFKSMLPYVILIANLGSFVGAFILIPIIDRGRKISTLVSLSGGFITAIAMILSILCKSSTMFFVSLFWNMVFSEWGWACLSTLQSELFPTGIRSTIIGFFISLEGVTTAILTLAEAYLTAGMCMVIIAMLWLAGTMAAASWYVKGLETARVSIDLLV